MAFISHLGDVLKFELIPGPGPLSAYQKSADLASCETTQLKATAFQFSAGTRIFQEKGHSELLSLGKGQLQIISLQCVTEQQTDVSLPCVLIQNKISKRQFLNFLVFYVPGSQKLFRFGHFRTEASIADGGTWVVNGPCVCWMEDGRLKIARKDASSESFKIRTLAEKNLGVTRQIKHCRINNGNLHVLIISESLSADLEREEERETPDVKWSYFVSQVGTYERMRSKTLSGEDCIHESILLPHVYASIACCVHLSNMDTTHNHHPCHNTLQSKPPTSVTSAKSQTIPTCTTIIATSRKQLLKFRNGRMSQFVWIPFDDAVRIVTMVMGGERMIAVMSGGGRVCVVRDSSFQIIQEWKSITSIHIDAFLDNGQDHLLLLHKPSDKTTSLNPFPEFIMTDMGLSLITSDLLLPAGKDQDNVKGQTSGHCPKNLLTTVQALEMRVKHGLTSLKEQELSCQQKERLIYQSAQRLGHMTQSQVTHQQRESSLVHLCGTLPECDAASDLSGGHCEVTQRLKVTAGWQGVIDEKWVIGLQVTNQSQWPVSDLYLLTIPKARSLTPAQSEGHLHHPSSGSSLLLDTEHQLTETASEPPHKRLKLEVCNKESSRNATEEKASNLTFLAPGSSCDVVAMTTLPEFVAGSEMRMQLVVEWVSRVPSDSTSEDGSRVTRKKRRYQPCGRVVLTAADVASGELQVQMPHATSDSGEVLSRTDELALNACQMTTCLTATSSYTPLTCLPTILCSKGFHQMGPSAMHDGLCCSSGALSMVRVYLSSVRTRSAWMKVCTKDTRQLMLFHHTFMSHLPDDVQFSLCTPPDVLEDAITNSLAHIELELHHTKCILDMACSTCDVGVGVENADRKASSNNRTGSDGGDEKLQRLRQSFREERSKDGHCRLKEDIAGPLRTKLLKLKENTDGAIALLSGMPSR